MINTDKLGEVGKLSVCFYGDLIEEFTDLSNENEQVWGISTQSIANMILITAMTAQLKMHK